MTEDHRAMPGPGQRRPWIPAVLDDRYEIDRELGAGAAAVTVAALDRRLGRRVAIKILKPEDDRDQGFSARFAREARAAAAINHPHVVSVYDVGEQGDLLYLVMQFVDGIDLKRLIERDGALPWRRAVEIAKAVLAGLAPIHEKGIVHRDIKPQNVLIGRDGEVKVTDFGVAHIERDGSLTAVGTTVGTAAYMAPEQAQGHQPTPAADVYAVGVMLYEMVTGRVPFDEPTSVATMLAHIQRAAPPPIAPGGMEPIPDGVRQVIAQAMAKEPRSRFRTAAAMRGALEHLHVAGEGSTWPSRSTGRTEVVPALQPRRPAARPVPAAAGAPPRYVPPVEKERGGGFGWTFVTILVLLAIVMAAAAGAMWLLEERPNLFAGSDDPPAATATAPDPTPTHTPASEAPVIEPQQPEPTSTPTPEPPTSTPPPTEPIIVPVDSTEPPADPSTDTGGEQIIEPIEGSTVVPEPQG
jgi:serine/threonine-protein kinase